MDARKRRHPLQVSDRCYQAIREIAHAQSIPMSQVVERAVEHLSNELMLLQANAEWERILEDRAAAEAIEAEQREFEGTLADGLDAHPWVERP